MNTRKPCGGPFKAPVIHVDGRVTVCCKDVSMELCLGNINEEPFERLWCSESANRLRLAHITGNLSEFPKCLCCNNLDSPIVDDAQIEAFLKSIGREELFMDYKERMNINK